MRARVALGASLLAASVLLAGCLAYTSPSPVTSADAGGSGLDAAGNATPSTPGNVPGSVPATLLSVDGPANHDTVVRNGSFTYYQSFYPAGWATGTYEDGIELTEKIPVGVPAQINVTLEYQEDFQNYVGLDLAVQGAQIYSEETVTSASQRTVWLDATVARHDADDRVVVQAEGYLPDDGSSEYTMRARVGAHTDIVTPRVPTLIDVPSEAQGFRLGFTGAEGSFQAMVWDPADRLVGQYEVGPGPAQADDVTVRLGGEHPPGRYVVLVEDVELAPGHRHDAGEPHHHHGVHAATLAPDDRAQAEPLELEYRWGGNKTVRSGQTVRWQPTFSKAPLQAGLVATPAGQPFTVNPATLSGHLRSPSGPVVDFDGHGFLLGFGGYAWISPVGHDALDEGTYRASFSNGGGTPVSVTHVAAFYQR